MDRHKKRYGERMDKMERDRKREARKVAMFLFFDGSYSKFPFKFG